MNTCLTLFLSKNIVVILSNCIIDLKDESQNLTKLENADDESDISKILSF